MLSSMGSYCVIIGDLDIITLSGVPISGTLYGGTVTGTLVVEILCTSLGTNVVWVIFSCMVLHSCANLLMPVIGSLQSLQGFVVQDC